MVLTFPITTPDILVILPGLEVSTTDSSATTDSWQTSVDDANNKTRTAGETRGCDFTSLTDHQIALFSLIAQFRGFYDVVDKRGFATDPENWELLLGYIEIFRDWLEFSLKVGHFDKSWLRESNETEIPSLQLATAQQSVELVSSFKLATNGKPTETKVNDFAKQFSAVVYSYTSRQGCFPIPDNLDDIPATVKNFYVTLVQGFTGSLVTAIRGSLNKPQAKFNYKYAKKRFEDTKKELIKLQTGQYTQLAINS